VKLSLKPHHLKRYKDIAMLFWKYGTSDLAKEFEPEDADEKNLPPAKPAGPRRKNWWMIWKKWGRHLLNSANCSPAALIFCRNPI
jgi:hypothetical protein